ncbi:MAG: YhgN family NAAT transporter [Candidatus Eiseniibacteriota bacterium]
MDLVSVAFTLFLVMDPLGNIPLFTSALSQVPAPRRRRVLVRELLIAYAVLALCLLIGQPLLAWLKLDSESISIAGGIVLFLIALRMIFPTEGGVLGEPVEGEPFIVPLAIPLLAGPSALSALLLLSRSAPNRLGDWFLALTIAWAASAAILLSSGVLVRLLRKRGLIAMERLMGMILVMLAVQLFLDGLSRYSGR